MPKFSLIFALLFLLGSTPTNANPSTSTGKAMDVADGDTITVLTQSGEKVKIRLAGVDCPESFQFHG
jgi:endonuclease YncB( thermonuclease family)